MYENYRSAVCFNVVQIYDFKLFYQITGDIFSAQPKALPINANLAGHK